MEKTHLATREQGRPRRASFNFCIPHNVVESFHLHEYWGAMDLTAY